MAVMSGERGLGVPLLPADTVRLAALVSVLLGMIGWGFVGFALFMLVLGGTMVPRAVGLPATLDAAYSLTILFGAWAAQLDWYAALPWLDLVVHTGIDAAGQRAVREIVATTGRAENGIIEAETVFVRRHGRLERGSGMPQRHEAFEAAGIDPGALWGP